ncbi:MAG: NADPH-dependent F420 reductase [Gammaproteobacteria bacterium]|nr:NADPH-dependent F420 reductase [Gammaproteobacteria bacterium]
MSDTRQTLAVIGGTGNIGYGLALRWGDAGYPVIIGSRAADKAETAAAEVNKALGAEKVRGMANPEAASAADIIVLTVPFGAQAPTLEAIHAAAQGKIVVDVTVPLVPPKVNRVQLPEEDSAALITQSMLGENVRVVSAFQNVGAKHLAELGHEIECDVLVCGDNKDARETVVQLAADAGLRGIHAGALANSVAAEALTSVLIWLNQRHKVVGSGIRITGLPE